MHLKVEALKIIGAFRNALRCQPDLSDAHTNLAIMLRQEGDLDAASAADTEALNLLGQLRQGGDTSEATAIALARGTQIKARILANQQSPEALLTAQRAVELIKPITDLPNPSRAARRAEVEVARGHRAAPILRRRSRFA